MTIKNHKGFSLIELMITVAIIGILSSVAVNYYGGNIISSKRTDGKAGILNAAASLNKCKAIYGSFDNANCSISDGDDIPSPDKEYFVAVATTATTFTLTATPAPGSSQEKDTDCTSIILNNLSQKSGTGDDPSKCW